MDVIKGKIAKVIDKNHVILDVGKTHGIKAGMEFLVFNYIKDIVQPDSKENLGDYDVIKGKLIIKSVRDNLSIGETFIYSPYTILEGRIEIKPYQMPLTTEDSDFLLIGVGDHVKSIPEPFMEAQISTQKVETGKDFTTTVKFKGFIINGFLDNAIIYPKSDGKGTYWNPDPKTWDRSRDTGVLQEFVDIENSWKFTIPEDAPEGRYTVSVRVYEDPFGIPKIGRYVVLSKEIPILVSSSNKT